MTLHDSVSNDTALKLRPQQLGCGLPKTSGATRCLNSFARYRRRDLQESVQSTVVDVRISPKPVFAEHRVGPRVD